MPGLEYGSIVDNKYRVLEPLGKGGMGEVYKVEHITLNKEMALKLLPSDNFSDDMWRRFKKEVHAASTLDHANLVKVFDFGLLPDKTPFYTMELVKGVSLSRMIRDQGPAGAQRCLAIFIPVCFALQYVHEHQIVHRDIKPGNIMINEDKSGRITDVKVLDFGIAKKVGQDRTETNSLTKPGEIVGSPFYMSPEQSEGKQVDARSDIYSLGCSLFHALTGAPPYRAKNAVSLAMLHTTSSIPSVISQNSALPEDLDYVVSTMLAKDPLERYQSMKEVVLDLIAIKAGNRPPSLKHTNSNRRSIPPRQTKSQTVVAAENDDDDDDDGEDILSKKNMTIAALAVALLAAVTFGAMSIFSAGHHSSNPSDPGSENGDDSTGSVTSSHNLLSEKQLDNNGLFDFKLHKDNKKLEEEKVESNVSKEPIKLTETDKPTIFFSKRGFTEGGKAVRVFDFPDDTNFGTIYSSDRSKHVACKGNVTLPVDGQFIFVPSQEFIKSPLFLARFRSDELEEIDFSGVSGVTDEHVKACENLLSLQKLNLNNTDITRKSIASLNKLTNLSALRIFGTSVNGEDLTKLNNLKKLHLLEARMIEACPALLKALDGSTNLHELKANDTSLKDSDLVHIGHLSNLQVLSIGNNPLLTAKGLNQLVGLKHLNNLSLYGVWIDADCCEALGKIKSLQAVKVSQQECPEAMFETLRKKLPRNCKLFYN